MSKGTHKMGKKHVNKKKNYIYTYSNYVNFGRNIIFVKK